jgi:hypothetical protein
MQTFYVVVVVKAAEGLLCPVVRKMKDEREEPRYDV